MAGRNDRQERDGPERDQAAWLPALLVLPLVLLSLLGAVHMLRREAARPMLGEIVLFSPGTQDRDLFRVAVTAWRVDPAADESPSCVLNSSVMGIAGGSLVVIRRLPTDPPWFRLAWAGERTELGPRDCGRSATVEVSRVDLRKLATAAGGFGLTRRSGRS